MLSANGLNVYILYFNMAATQKFSCRNLVGPSLSRPTLFCFGLVWSNQTAGKMYPELDDFFIVTDANRDAIFPEFLGDKYSTRYSEFAEPISARV